jgi:hypothetical protein
VELEYPRDLESSVDGSIATGILSILGQVKGEGLDKYFRRGRQLRKRNTFGTAIIAEEVRMR